MVSFSTSYFNTKQLDDNRISRLVFKMHHVFTTTFGCSRPWCTVQSKYAYAWYRYSLCWQLLSISEIKSCIISRSHLSIFFSSYSTIYQQAFKLCFESVCSIIFFRLWLRRRMWKWDSKSNPSIHFTFVLVEHFNVQDFKILFAQVFWFRWGIFFCSLLLTYQSSGQVCLVGNISTCMLGRDDHNRACMNVCKWASWWASST